MKTAKRGRTDQRSGESEREISSNTTVRETRPSVIYGTLAVVYLAEEDIDCRSWPRQDQAYRESLLLRTPNRDGEPLKDLVPMGSNPICTTR